MSERAKIDLTGILRALGVREKRVCGRPTQRGTPCKAYCGDLVVACDRHITPQERAGQEERVRHESVLAEAERAEAHQRVLREMAIDPRRFFDDVPIPVCHAWEPPSADQVRGWELLMGWHQHLCAVCGAPGGAEGLRVDHCHDSGMVRGLLCVSCNFLEGHGVPGDGRFSLYRQRPPAVIVGWTQLYDSPFFTGPERWVVVAFGEPPAEGEEAVTYLQQVRQRLTEDPAARSRHLKPRGPVGRLRRPGQG